MTGFLLLAVLLLAGFLLIGLLWAELAITESFLLNAPPIRETEMNTGKHEASTGAFPSGLQPGRLAEDSGESLTGAFLPPKDGPLLPHRCFTRAELIKPAPAVLIASEAYVRMQLYVQLAPKEVGWQGTVTLLETGEYLIEEVFLTEQYVDYIETDLSIEGRAKLCEELIEQGGEAGIDRVNRLRFWGHSHVRMPVHPSPTDNATMLKLRDDGLPWGIRGIFNKPGDAVFDIYLFEEGIRLLDVPWQVVDANKRALLAPAQGFNREENHLLKPGFRRNSEWGRQERSLRQPDALRQSGMAVSSPTLPAELIASDKLRAEVGAELKAKLKELSWKDKLQSRLRDI